MRADHLLNFQRYDGGRGGGSGARRARSAPRRAPYDRNKFLAANFSFVVSDAADVAAASVDPDLPLDWDDILQVDMQTTGEVTCPIALGPPVAPQITPCGHVFSFPAIVQHLVTHGGDNFRRTAPCPLCFAQIAARELRLFTSRTVRPIKIGDTLEFALLRRPRTSIIPHEVLPLPQPGSPAKPGRPRDSPKKDNSGPATAGEASAAVAALGGSPGAQKAAAAAWKRKDEAADAGDSEAAQIHADRFAKFTIVADPAPLWRRAAEELARHAAQIVAEGGPDAEAEAPYVWIAQDLLAARAAGAAERRQRALLAASPPAAASAMPSAADAGAAAARAVKQVAEAATLSASEAAARAAEAAAIAAAFPSLPGGRQAAGIGTNEPAEAAFSDEEAVSPSAAGAAHAAQPKAEPAASSFSSDGAASALAGGSPPGHGGSVAPPPAEQHFFQAADGQAAFLASLPARMLAAAAGGSLADAPPRFAAKVVDMESVTQTAATRRRYRTLSHVPLGGTFTLVDVDLAGIVPPAVFDSFGEELGSRAAKRAARAAADAQAAEKEAAAERAAAAAAMGPSAAELKAMPRPSTIGARRAMAEQGGDDLAAALAESALLAEGHQASAEADDDIEAGSPPPPANGVSFASMARLGFAATGPTLGSSPQQGSPAATGVWGGAAPKPWGPAVKAAAGRGEQSGASSPWAAAAAAGVSGGGAASSSAPKHADTSDGLLLRPLMKKDADRGGGGGSGKKSKPVLLFSSGQRRY